MELSKKRISAAILLILLACLFSQAYSRDGNGLKPGKLTCEYIENPLGIDIPRPRLSWTLVSGGRNEIQSAYELIVSDDWKEIKRAVGSVWKTGKIVSSQNLHIEYAGGALRSFTRYYWRVRVYDKHGNVSSWSDPQWFETAVLSSSSWQAEWISDGNTMPEQEADFYKDDPMPLFRKTFTVEKKIASARLYISGLGYYEAYLNGEKIGGRMLDPGWTSYREQVLYSVYDISAFLHRGKNAAGIMLGNGWYNPLPLRFWGVLNMRDALETGRPCVKAMIRILYTDGSAGLISTDNTWTTAPGPIIRNSVYLGEQYDARLEKAEWCSPAAADGGWRNAVKAEGPSGILTAQMQPPVRVTGILKPVGMTEPKPGVFVFDMGQNFAGVARIRVKGPSGTKVTLRYGEDIYEDGSLNGLTVVAGQIKTGIGGPGAPSVAWQQDSYILKGEGIETWSPRFTFHGFRYIEVTGWPGKPGPDAIEGLRMNADVKESGHFTSSNEMFNKLDEVLKWTFMSNVFSVISDCPGREKLAYGGDIICTTEAFMFHYDMPNFYAKVVRDHANDQRPLGGITETAPYVGIADAGPGDKSGPLGYQAGFPFVIKKMYDFYGDKRIIRDNYEKMVRHVKFLESTARDNLFDTDLGDHEMLGEKSIPLTASVFYYLHVKLLEQFAGILEKSEDQRVYSRLSGIIRNAILEKYRQEGSGKFAKGTQSDQLFALWSDIIPEGDEEKVFEVLVREYEKHNWHLSTGIFGTKMMFDVLRKMDKNEMAYRIANQRDFPGWGHMLKNGATTLWETWAYSDNTYSHNHPMFGSVGAWFYRSLLGINEAAPGFERIIIKPQPAGDLTNAKGHFNSLYGKIASGWEIVDGRFHLEVEIPANTRAEIWIPLRYGTHILEGRKPVSETASIKALKREAGYAVFETGSGSYSFVASQP